MRFTIALWMAARRRYAALRLVSTVLLTLMLACLLLSQSPIGFGSMAQLDTFDWWLSTASGCTAGARGMCVGHTVQGDTNYFSGWFADASLLPITNGLPIVGTLNDFTSKTCSGNLMLIQLAAFDWAARNASRVYEVNCMSGYGTSPGTTDTPAGWFGHCTNADNGSLGCTWKSREPFVRNGMLYLPVERQISAGTQSIHDATMIVSADGGQTWKNPYTVAHGGAASATGDAPRCGAASGTSGSACTDVSYPGSIMWTALPLALSTWQVVQYGQDGATPPTGITDGCDPATYTCFMGGEQEGTLARVLNTDLPSLDVTKYQYYTCPAITDTYRCPGSASSSWTSTFANRTPVIYLNLGNQYGSLSSSFFGLAYIKEFHTYLMTGRQMRGTDGTLFSTAPTIQGPWTPILSTPVYPGFIAPVPAFTTVVGTNPPHIKLTTERQRYGDAPETSMMFERWDLVLGRTPMMNGGENPRYNNIGAASTYAGYIITDSHATGTIPEKDLAWAFDFYDHGGDTLVGGMVGFHDIAKGVALLAPCRILGGPAACGWSSGQGVTLASYGGHLVDSGYGASFVSMMHETPQTIAIGTANTATAGLTLQNAPAAMQGNGTYTVAGVFRIDATGYNQVPLWVTGDASSTNTKVTLSYNNSTGGPLVIDWTNNDASPTNRWRYASTFTPTLGNWYFIAVTVQANGATPIAHMWVGVGGALVDEIAGVTRTQAGSATQTPNVVAAPLRLGMDASGTHNAAASYATLLVYSRALGQAEVGLMYNTLKAKMASRGVTLQ